MIKPGDFVVFVRHDGFVEKRGQRQVGKRILRGDAFLAALGRDAGELVAAAQTATPWPAAF